MYVRKDYLYKKAKQDWFLARSIYKLEEIDRKFNIFWKSIKNILDIWCAPWSRIQYCINQMQVYKKKYKIIWFDLLDLKFSNENVFFFKHNIDDKQFFDQKMNELSIKNFDIILSDLAPNTSWISTIDTNKYFQIIEKIIPIINEYLIKRDWKFVIKYFMWESFEKMHKILKDNFWTTNLKVFNSKWSRKGSKEIYFVKYK